MEKGYKVSQCLNVKPTEFCPEVLGMRPGSQLQRDQKVAFI